MSLPDEIQKFYIAYFNRPADPRGLSYWVEIAEKSNGDLTGLSSAFAASPEFVALYHGKSPADLVTSVYQNLFGRDPEPAGLLYWSSVLEHGAATISTITLAVMASAQGSDITAVANKLLAANLFTRNIDTPAEILGYAGESALAAARAFLNKIDAREGSLAKLEAIAKQAVIDATGVGHVVVTPPTDPGTSTPPPPPVFTAKLSGGTVEFSHAGSNVVVTASGSLPNLVYTFTSDGSQAGSSTIQGPISHINVPAGLNLKASSDVLSNISMTGAGTVELSDSTIDAAVLSHIDLMTAGLVNAPDLTGITAGDTTDVQAILDAVAQGTALSVPMLETIAVLSGTSLTLLAGTVAQGKSLTIDGSLMTTALILDASGVAGSLTVIGGSVADTLTGGAGDDIFIGFVGQDSVNGGGGINTLNLVATSPDLNAASDAQLVKVTRVDASTASAGVTVNLSLQSEGFEIIGSTHNDTITGGIGVNTLTGGAGNDTFSYNAANRSTYAKMDTIEDYRLRVGEADQISIDDIITVASNVNTVQNLSAQSSLSNALNIFANAATVSNGLGVFIWNDSTYIFIESVGSAISYMAGDTVIKLTGTPFPAGTSIVGLGIDGV